jgi:hypothetical protein
MARRRKAYEGEKRVNVDGKEYVGHYFLRDLIGINIAFNPHGKEVQARLWEPKMPVTSTTEAVTGQSGEAYKILS